MGKVGGGEWYCRGGGCRARCGQPPPPELGIASQRRCVSSREEVPKTAECLGQVRWEGRVRVVGEQAWLDALRGGRATGCGGLRWDGAPALLESPGDRVVGGGVWAGRSMGFCGCWRKES